MLSSDSDKIFFSTGKDTGQPYRLSGEHNFPLSGKGSETARLRSYLPVAVTGKYLRNRNADLFSVFHPSYFLRFIPGQMTFSAGVRRFLTGYQPPDIVSLIQGAAASAH